MKFLCCILFLSLFVYVQMAAVCPGGLGVVYCFEDPCWFAPAHGCHGYPDAKCVSNYCGGCNAEWFESNGNQVFCHAA